mgnify:CR=1 FL=1
MCKSSMSEPTTRQQREERLRRNRISAKLCRQRRKKYHSDLASRLANLEATNARLVEENMNLKLLLSEMHEIDCGRSVAQLASSRAAPAHLVDEIEDYFA